MCAYTPTHSFSQSLTHSLIPHSLIHRPTHPPTPPITYPLSLPHSHPHSLTHPPTTRRTAQAGCSRVRPCPTPSSTSCATSPCGACVCVCGWGAGCCSRDRHARMCYSSFACAWMDRCVLLSLAFLVLTRRLISPMPYLRCGGSLSFRFDSLLIVLIDCDARRPHFLIAKGGITSNDIAVKGTCCTHNHTPAAPT